MSICLTGFAELIKIAGKRCKEARDPQAALDALDDFNALLQDHQMVELLASAYLLTSTIVLDVLETEGGKPD